MPEALSITASETVTATLQYGERRLRQARTVAALALVAACGSALVLAIAVWRAIAPVPRSVTLTATAIAVISVVATAATALWVYRRHGSLADAAARVDRAAGLRDELRSAHWFIEHDPATPWTDLQVSRAARTAAAVDADALFPLRVPSAAWATAAMLVLAAFLAFVPGGAALRWWSPTDILTDADRAQIRKVAERLALADDPELARLADRINELLARDRPAGELYVELEALRALLRKAGAMLDADAVDRALSEMAGDLRNAASLEDIAAALEKRAAGEAADALRKASRQNSAQLSDAEQQALQQALRKAGARSNPNTEAIANELKKAADRLAQRDEGGADRSLEKAADALEELGRQKANQKLAADAARDLERPSQSLAQKAEAQSKSGQMTDDQPQRSQAGKDAPMNEAEEFRAGAGGQGREAGDTASGAMQERSGSDREGRGGMAGGGGGAASRRTTDQPRDIALRQEQLPGQAPDPAPEPDVPLVDRASKAAPSVLPFRRSEASTYRDAETMTTDTVPRSYQDLVKTYFHALGPRRTHDH